MNEQNINNAVAENPDANRLKRIKEAQTYHSPVEEKIRSYEAKAEKLNTPPPAPVEPIHNGLFVTVRPLGAKPKTPAPQPTIKNAMAEGAPQQGNENGSPNAQPQQQQPQAPARRTFAQNGTEYVIEDTQEGPSVIASARDGQPVRMYDKPIPVTDEMLTSEQEKTFLEKAMATSADVAKGAYRGLGMGLTNLTLNTMRTAIDNPIGEQVVGADRVQAFEDFTNKYIDDMKTWAEGQTKTAAGGVAQAGGEMAMQFVVPAVKLYNGFRAMKATPLMASFLSDVAVSVFGVRPEDPNLSNLIPEDSKAFGALRELLGTNPDDPEWVNRARNAAETIAMLGVGEAAGRGIIKGIEEVKRLSTDGEIGAKLSGLIDKAMQRKMGGMGGRKNERGSVGGDYRGIHKAPSPENGAPLNELTGNIYPEDIYSSKAAQYYGHGDKKLDAETVKIMQSFRGQPDKKVKIYRAIPDGLDTSINTGDWVTINRNYAVSHGESALDGRYKIIEASVPAKDIYTNGDSIHEWGYFPSGDVSPAKNNIFDLSFGGGSKSKIIGDTEITYGVSRDGKSAEVILLKTDSSMRGKGSARKAMQSFLEETDQKGITVFLTAEPMDKGVSKSKLDKFYKSLGFKENKGKNKDFTSKAEMVRTPLVLAAGVATGATLLSPEEAQANARTDVLQKAIGLLNDTKAVAGKAAITDEMVQRIKTAAEGTNPVEGLDFNLARIEDGQQLGEVIDEVSRIYAEPINKAKRGVQTFDAIQEQADLSRSMGFDVGTVLARQQGDLWPAHKIKAARDIFVAEITKTKSMALAIKQPGGNSDDALVAFRRQLAVNAALQAQIKGAQTEVARSLAQFRMTAKSPLETRVQMREILDQAGGQEVNEKMVDAFINAVDNGGPDAAAIFSREAQNITGMDMLFEAWINSLLGAPPTHMVNMMGNSLAATQGIMERYAAAGYGTLERGVAGVRGIPLEPGGITFGEAHAYAQGLAGSTMDALRAFGKAMKEGKQADTFGKLDYNREAITTQNMNQLPIAKSIAGRIGKDELIDANSKLALTVDFLGEYYYRLPGRFLMAEDDFFKTLNYRAELHARVAREMSDMPNATLEEKQARALQIMADPQVAAPDIHLGSIDQMREQTFTSPPGPIAQRMNQFLNEAKVGDFPAGRVVVPFFNVINNIVKYVGSRTPGLALINPKSKTFQDLFSGDPARRQLVMGKWMTGGSIMGTAAWLNLNGVCTGRLTDNPNLRKQMEVEGKKPFSCMVPMPDGTYRAMQYNRLDPVGMTMGIAATTAEVLHYVDDEETREMIGIAATSAIMPYLEEKSYFSGIADFMNALTPQYGNDDARVEAMRKYFIDLASSAPGAIGGPLAPNTPLARFVTREGVGDDARRDPAPDKYRIEKDAWGDDIMVANGSAYRTWEGIVRKVMSGTPGLSDNLPAMTNIWGEDIRMENGLTPNSRLSPIMSSTIKYDVKALRSANLPDKAKAGYFYGLKVGQDMTLKQFDTFVNIVGINGELERLGAPMRKPRRELAARNGNKVVGMPVELNAVQYHDFIKLMNQISVPNDADPERRSMNMKQALDWIVKQPEYAKLPDDMDAKGSKGDILRSYADKYRDAATNIFFADHKDGPALLRRSIELKLKAQNTGAR